MEILSHKSHQELLNYLQHVRASLQEWLLLEVRLTEQSKDNITVRDTAELIHSLFGEKEGKIYICNDHEVLMLVRWGRNAPEEVTKKIEKQFPEGSCEVQVHAPTVEGLTKLELQISVKHPITLAKIRRAREEKIILVADDDMYMRLLVKKGVGQDLTVYEVANGDEVLAAYKKLAPNILFLDIHMPNVEGTVILQSILALDPEAYVVMLSADSSPENVLFTKEQGAKWFVGKPFTKEKLQECIRHYFSLGNSD